jgi:hypothetical protein
VTGDWDNDRCYVQAFQWFNDLTRLRRVTF